MNEKPNIESGQVYQDSMYQQELFVKYADDETVLLQDTESEHHHLYSFEQFEEGVEKEFVPDENRFTLINNGD